MKKLILSVSLIVLSLSFNANASEYSNWALNSNNIGIVDSKSNETTVFVEFHTNGDYFFNITNFKKCNKSNSNSGTSVVKVSFGNESNYVKLKSICHNGTKYVTTKSKAGNEYIMKAFMSNNANVTIRGEVYPTKGFSALALKATDIVKNAL